ncbi:MAG TPA: hypothetical protein VFK03_00245, partial [Candidatus Saccharimonadales bacterium]|nr:hypothetical protein [Candidatus Saccharimonadales bacterium]
MPTQTPLKPDSDQNNPGRAHADDLFEQHGVLDEGIASPEGAVDQARARLRGQEQDPANPSTEASDEELAKIGAGGNSFYLPPTTKRASYRARFKNNKKLLTGLGFGGGALMLLLVGFISFIPFKLEMMLKTVEAQVAQIPQEAIENRLQYLTSRYLAMRLLGTNMPDTYPDTPFKSLYKTWRANNFEKKMGIKIESNRTNNHQTATKWKITLADDKGLFSEPIEVNGRNLDSLTRQINIDNSREMRSFIKGTVNERTHWASLYKRYAMRKTLMRTLGVTRWSWLPGASTLADKYNNKKLELKKSWVEKLTEGNVKVAGRTGLYMSCLMSTDACNELHRRGFSTRVLPTRNDQPFIENCDSKKGEAKKACERHNKKKQAANDRLTNSGNASASTYEDAIGSVDANSPEASKIIRKLVIKQVMSKVLGPAALVDFIANVVESVDHGSINQIIYDRNAIMSGNVAAIYQSFNDQFKMTDADPAQIDVVMQQIAGFGANPAWQAMAGIIKDPSSTQVQRECVDRTGDTKTETLPKGQLVCENKMLITDATSFTSNGWWDALETLAHVWNSSVGKIFKVFNKIAGSVIDKLGIDDMIGWIMKIPGISKLGDLVQTGIIKMVNFIFGVPFTPFDTGKNAADGIIAGLTASSFKLGESSIDFSESGVTDTDASSNGLGIGGQILDPTEVAALHSQIAAADADIEANKPMLARLFDTNDPRSFISQLAIRTPTSFAEMKNFGGVLASSVTSMFMPRTAAAADMKNPFFEVNIAYGYKPGTT